MSVLNVFPGIDVVRFAVDTAAAVSASPGASAGLAVGLDPASFGTSKIVPIVHVGGVIAGRGNLFFLSTVFGRMLCETDRCFDALCDRLTSVCDESARAVSAAAQACGFAPPGELGEVVMAGWSRDRQGMRTVVVFGAARRTSDPFDLVEPWVTPGTTGFPVVPDAPTRSQIHELTIQQVLRFRTPSDPFYGGQLIFAEASAAGVTFDWSVDIEREALISDARGQLGPHSALQSARDGQA